MRLEHINLTVSDLDRSVRFYRALLDLEVRWEGQTNGGAPAVHLGGAENYLALFEAEEPAADQGGAQPPVAAPVYERPGLNHFGLQVEDLARSKARLKELGVEPHFEPEYEPGQRLYFYDPDGVEVELVSYAEAGR